MPNDLIGVLADVRLFDLVKPLVDGKKSGAVVIKGKGTSELYIEGGTIVHAEADSVIGEEAVHAIMDLDDGRVTFNWQLSPAKQTVSMSTEQLMSNWAMREEEWTKVKKVMSSSEAVFSIAVDGGGKDRTILSNQWGVLALCNGIRTVSDIAALLERSVFEVSETVCQLADIGALKKEEVAEAPEGRMKGTVDETFFVEVETELKKLVGPIARVIMNDTLEAFEESRDAFPRDLAMSFIRTISDQIVEEQKRDQFDRAMFLVWAPLLEKF